MMRARQWHGEERLSPAEPIPRIGMRPARCYATTKAVRCATLRVSLRSHLDVNLGNQAAGAGMSMRLSVSNSEAPNTAAALGATAIRFCGANPGRIPQRVFGSIGCDVLNLIAGCGSSNCTRRAYRLIVCRVNMKDVLGDIYAYYAIYTPP